MSGAGINRTIDLTGQRFGRLTVETFAGNNASRSALWRCRCDCGGSVTAAGAKLRAGRVASCGCVRAEKLRAAGGNRLLDLTGLRFGRLTVLSRAANAGNQLTWNCRCDCGGEKVVRGIKLKCGSTLSCGCRRQEVFEEFARLRREDAEFATAMRDLERDATALEVHEEWVETAD